MDIHVEVEDEETEDIVEPPPTTYIERLLFSIKTFFLRKMYTYTPLQA